MREFLRHILARPVALGMACCAIAFGGIFGLMQLPLGLVPSLDFPALSVHMSWAGVSAESIEQTLTAPVEEIVSSLKGVRKVRSVSQEGWSRVEVEFDRRTDMNFARLELNERLAMFARQIPRGASRPVVERFVPEDIEKLQGFLSYSLSGSFPRSTLARIASQDIIPRLLSVKGVARVMLQGAGEEELRVELSPDKLAAAGVGPEDVMTALEGSHRANCNGRVQGLIGVTDISFAQKEASLRQFEETPVRRGESPSLLRLRDLGRATIVPAASRELLRVNGKQCLTLIVERDPNSSLPASARAVRSCLAGLSSGLPPAVELVCEVDRSRRMEDELNVLYRDALISLVLFWGILRLFLGNNHAPLVLISSVFLSIAGTFLVLWILSIPLHLLTLAGLALGTGRLLDDSIVVLENLRRWTESGTTAGLIVEGTHEVIMPVLASTAAIAGAMMPVLFLPGDLQLYLVEFAITVIVSLSVSLLVSISLIPSAALQWRMQGGGMLVSPRGRIVDIYRWLLGGVLRHRMLVVVAAVWIFGFPVWLLPVRIESNSMMARLYNETVGSNWYLSARPVINTLLGGTSYQFFKNVPHAEFLEQGGETYLIMQMDFPQGTGLSKVDDLARVVEQDLLRAGAPRVTTRVFDAAIFLRVDFPDSVVATPVPMAIRHRCFRLAAQMGGAAVSVAGFGAGFSGGADLQPAFIVRVLGYDYARVRQIAEALCQRLLANPRVVSADIDRSFGNWSRAQEIALSVGREAGERYGINSRDVAGAVRDRAGVLPLRLPVKLQGVQIPCVVTVKGADRFSVDDLVGVAVRAGAAAPVPLRSLLAVEQRAAPSEIVREDQQYVRLVSFEYKGPYRHAQAFLDATINSFDLPDGYRFDRSDTFTVSGKNREALLLAVLGALLVVFMVTASLYESLIDPFIIILSVPFAYIGVFVAFVLAGMPFGRGGYLSVIFLTGIAVANAIVIVDFIARKAKEPGDRMASIIEASVCRLRPVIMTTLATVGSLVPMLLGDRSGLWYSVALGTMGGMLSSTLLTLVLMPVVYTLAHRIKETLPPNPLLLGREGG